MNFWELLLLAVGLSMDAFAASVCKGLSLPRLRARDALTVGIWFGGFQALMPLAGCALGSAFAERIIAVDHWVAFGLLALIGGNMLWEGLSPEEGRCEASLRPLEMFPLALATSIDALAVGITFAFLRVSILPAAGLIGAVTCALSALGVFLGRSFGIRYRARAQIMGGSVLLGMGAHILLEHLGIL